jgi:RNA polymerase-binding transcription factor DksA
MVTSSFASPLRNHHFSETTRLRGVSEHSNESVVAIENTLNEVDRALERLRVGTYRTCQVCGAPIDDAELVNNPLLANCRAHPELS